MDEAPHHPHNVARNVFTELDGVTQPMPAPRFAGTSLAPPVSPEAAGASEPRDVLAAWGLDADEVGAAQRAGILG
jgi:alpha-methylacyl-CoA racemase